VEWDFLKIQNKGTYKELRSLVKNHKITLQEAQDIVVKHFQKTLGKTTFSHLESQKESAIVMD